MPRCKRTQRWNCSSRVFSSNWYNFQQTNSLLDALEVYKNYLKLLEWFWCAFPFWTMSKRKVVLITTFFSMTWLTRLNRYHPCHVWAEFLKAGTHLPAKFPLICAKWLSSAELENFTLSTWFLLFLLDTNLAFFWCLCKFLCANFLWLNFGPFL